MGTFALIMTKVEAPDWHVIFSNVADDLEALWYAALWFEERPSGFPTMDFEVKRRSSEDRGPISWRHMATLPLRLVVWPM